MRTTKETPVVQADQVSSPSWENAGAGGWDVPFARPAPSVLSEVDLVICQVTEHCNLTCRYCSALAPSASAGVSLMSHTTARSAAETIFSTTSKKRVSWIFFGGEPLLAPIEWFRRTRDGLIRIADRHKRALSFGMQTNGTLITDEVADFLVEIGLRPSVSLDGPPHIHDALRGNARETVAGIRRLVERGSTPTLLVVLGPHNISRIDEVIDFFLDQGLDRAKFNIWYPAGRAAGFPPLDPTALAHARWRILMRMLDSDSFYDVNTARMMFHLIRGGTPRHDEGRACGALCCGAGVHHVAVAPGGCLFPCDRTAGSHTWRLGNVGEPLDALRSTRRVRAFHEIHRMDYACATCEARPVCVACCTAYRTDAHLAATLCEASRRLWPLAEAERIRIEHWVQRKRRQGKSRHACDWQTE